MKRIFRWKSLAVALVLSGLAAAAILFVVDGRAAASDEGPTAIVTRDTVDIRVEEVGIVEPFRKVALESKIAGQVLEVHADVGDRVKAGDVLIRLDPHDTKQELRRATAEHRVHRVQLDQAQKLLGFKQKAHELGVLSDLELAAVQGDVRRLEAGNAVHAAVQSQLRDQIEATKLASPIDGAVLARHAEPGEMVTPGVAAVVEGNPLMVVAQVDRLLVRAELNQLDVARLTVGQPVELRVDAIPEQVFEGKVFRIAAMAGKSERRPDSRLQVFPVDVVVDASQPGAGALKPGMIADLRVHIESREDVLTVPLEALVYEDGEAHVRRIEGETETLVAVRVGKQNAQVAEIVDGVNEGDELRIRPADTEARN